MEHKKDVKEMLMLFQTVSSNYNYLAPVCFIM